MAHNELIMIYTVQCLIMIYTVQCLIMIYTVCHSVIDFQLKPHFAMIDVSSNSEMEESRSETWGRKG